MTDYQRWVFGTFDDNKSHGYVSKIKAYSDEEPSVGQALLYWAEYVSFSLPSVGVWLMLDPLLETSKDSALPRRMSLEWKLYSPITQLDETRLRREERANPVSRRLMRVM